MNCYKLRSWILESTCNLMLFFVFIYRYLFFTDWLEPAKVCRLDMDGTNLKILVNGANISWPNGLAIDSNKLYWGDAKVDRIESINFDGSDRTVLLRSTKHVFGLAVDEEFIYWSDWLSKSIHKRPKNGTTEMSPIRVGYSGLMGIKIFDKKLQMLDTKLRYSKFLFSIFKKYCYGEIVCHKNIAEKRSTSVSIM